MTTRSLCHHQNGANHLRRNSSSSPPKEWQRMKSDVISGWMRWYLMPLACLGLGLGACESGAPLEADARRRSVEPPPVGSAIIHQAPGLPPGDYVVSGSNPGIITGSRVTMYGQVHLGYPVIGFGYFVTTKDGIVYGKNGSYLNGLPNEWPKPMSEPAALAVAIRELNIDGAPPWVANPKTYHVPKGSLAWVTTRRHESPEDFVLAWCFDLRGAGVGFIGIELDAVTGKLVVKHSGIEE